MIIKILHRWTNACLWEGEAETMYAAVVAAVSSGVNLFEADLSWANLREANVLPAIPIVPSIDSAILAAIETPGNELYMGDWHRCETTHCRAGWAVHLAGKPGYDLQRVIGPEAAGRLIYEASRPGFPAPNFFADNDAALADIRASAAAEAEAK